MSARLVRTTLASCYALLLACGSSTSEPTTGPPARLLLIEGASQTGTFGVAAPVTPTVLVTDANNQPLRGVTVTFTPAAGSGTVQTASASTLANGSATPGAWTLGSRFSAMTLTATVAGLPPVTFTASAIAPSAGVLAFSLADALGDTLANPLGGRIRAPDVLSLRGDFRRDSLILTLTFAAPIVDPSAGAVIDGYIEFDLDESASTGSSPLSNIFGGTAQLGVDRVIAISGTSAGIGDSFGIGGFLPTQVNGNTIVIGVPMRLLNSDDGRLGLVGIVGTQDRPTDIFPNTGSVAVRTAGSFILPGSAGPLAPQSLRAPRNVPFAWGMPRF